VRREREWVEAKTAGPDVFVFAAACSWIKAAY